MNKAIFNEIIAGWSNYVFKNERIENIAKHRLTICLDCKKLSNLKTCKKCGCYIPAKVRSEKSKCPMGYWKL